MCSDSRKNHGCGQKKPEGTSSAIFGFETASKCCELEFNWSSQQNRQQRWSPKANLNFSPELLHLNWTFLLPPKRQLSILWTFFSNKIVFDFLLPLLVLPQCGSPCDFAPKTRDTAQGYIKCMSPHISEPVVRTDGRSRDYYITTKISCLDRLPNWLSNGAPMVRSAINLFDCFKSGYSPAGLDKHVIDFNLLALTLEAKSWHIPYSHVCWGRSLHDCTHKHMIQWKPWSHLEKYWSHPIRLSLAFVQSRRNPLKNQLNHLTRTRGQLLEVCL